MEYEVDLEIHIEQHEIHTELIEIKLIMIYTSVIE